MCAVDGGIVAGTRATRRARAGSATSSLVRAQRRPRRVRRRGLLPRRLRPEQLLDEKAVADRVGGARARRAGLGGRQLLGAGGRRLSGAIVGLDPRDHRAGDLPGVARVDRIRYREDHRDVRRVRRAGDRAAVVGRPDQEQAADADLRDATRRLLSVIGSDQGPALQPPSTWRWPRALYPDVPAAADAMGRINSDVYEPDSARADVYETSLIRGVRAAVLPTPAGREQGHVPAAGDQGPGPSSGTSPGRPG